MNRSAGVDPDRFPSTTSPQTEDHDTMSKDSPSRSKAAPTGDPGGDPGLDRLITCLPPQIPPERDLWEDIEARLTEPPRSLRRHPLRSLRPVLAGLALAAGLAGAFLGLGWLMHATSVPPAAGTATTTTTTDGYRVPAADAFDRSLVAALERRRLELGPETASAVEADIARLGGAVSDLLLALASHPDDPVLHRHLAARQHQQAALLSRLSRL